MATPPASVAVPSEVEPLKNLTLPVGVADPGLAALTVAVSVTLCPTTGDDGKDVSTVDEAASPTVTVTGDEVLDVKLLSPEYCTVIELEATGKVVVEKRAHSIGECAIPGASYH